MPKAKTRAPSSLALLSLTPEGEAAGVGVGGASGVGGVGGMVDPVALCSAVQCKRGRECRVLSSGLPDCVCREDGRPAESPDDIQPDIPKSGGHECCSGKV